MLTYPSINPIALQIGPITIHWYGLMYLFGFMIAWILGVIRAKKNSKWNNQLVTDLIFYSAVGVLIGGRLGYILFYDFHDFIRNPLIVFKIWEGGMSFHGGLLGVIGAVILYCHNFNKHFLTVTDFIAPLVPIGLGFGRIGNFINQELWGRVTDAPWGMVFPLAGPLPRHPSMLYEAFLEGLVLFIIIWIYSAKARPQAAVTGLFLSLYGSFRFFIEFFRQPDPQLGYIAFGWLTMGQLLSLPMILGGGFIIYYAYRYQRISNNE